MTKLSQLQTAFEALANPQQAEKMTAYIRHLFPFYGVRAADRRQLYKALIATDKKNKVLDWDLLEAAWANPYRELDYFVCDYLRARSKDLTAADLPKLIPFFQTKQWWETIDNLAPTLGQLALRSEQARQLILDWASSDDFWLRRTAIIHQLGRKGQTDPEFLSQIIKLNLGQTEFFINKAIGWALRDYARHNPDWVKHFVADHRDQLAPLSIKEATKHLED